MPTARAAGTGCLPRTLGAWVVIAVAATPVGLAGGYLAALLSIPRAERAWAAQVEPMESFIARYPPEPSVPAPMPNIVDDVLFGGRDPVRGILDDPHEGQSDFRPASSRARSRRSLTPSSTLPASR